MNAAPRMTLHEMRALVCSMTGRTEDDDELVTELTRKLTAEIDNKPQIFDFGRSQPPRLEQTMAAELWHKGLLKLPFPVTVFTIIPHNTRMTFLAFQDVNVEVPGRAMVEGVTGILVMTQPGVNRVDGFTWFSLPKADLLSTGAVCLSECEGETDESFQSFMMGCVAMVLRLSILLNTKGLKKRHEPVPVKLNQKRARSGKPPLDAVTYINLDGVSNSTGSTNEREMPMHLRRGHIRHYDDGSVTWVRDTIVKADGPLKDRVRYQIR